MSVAESTGKAMGLLPSGCQVPEVQGRGEGHPASIIFLDDAILGRNQKRKDGARCKALTESLAMWNSRRWGRDANERNPYYGGRW